MRILHLLLLIPALALTDCSCKKPKDTPITGGGKGGSAVINVTPVYYSDYVDTCTVYVKYGTLDAPATGIYDDSIAVSIVGGKPVASFTGLKIGLYYFYAHGYHSTGGHPPNVQGGISKTVQTEATSDILLPTTYIP
jgi:hypothetical protein